MSALPYTVLLRVDRTKFHAVRPSAGKVIRVTKGDHACHHVQIFFTTEGVPMVPLCNANNSADAMPNGVKIGTIHAGRHDIEWWIPNLRDGVV